MSEALRRSNSFSESSEHCFDTSKDGAMLQVQLLSRSSSNSKVECSPRPKKMKPRKAPSSDCITVYNDLKSHVFIAIYYKWRIGWGDAIRVGELASIPPKENIQLPRPSIRTDKSRKLVMTLVEEELTEKLPHKALSRLHTIGVDLQDEIYVMYTSKESESAVLFRGYTKSQYTQRQQKSKTKKNESAKEPPSTYKHPLRHSLRFAMNVKFEEKEENLEPEFDVEGELVTRREELCTKEKKFLHARNPKTRSAIETFLGLEKDSLEPEFTPRIAFCGSGGGARAMLCTIGALQGLSDIQVVDCCTYVAGLSGSTWAFSVWEALHLTPDELVANVRYKFEHGHMITPTTPVFPELKQIVLSKFLYDHSKISVVNDIYAAQLSVHLFRDTEPPRTKLNLTDLAETAQLHHGDYPLPIFVSSIQEPNGEYEWFEFTPYTVGCVAYDCFVPTPYFGKKFQNGKLRYPKEDASEICLAYLLATFASAFCAPLGRVADEFFEKMEVQPISLLSENLFECRDNFTDLLVKFKISHNSAIEAPLFRNYMYGTKRSPIRKLKYFPLLDSGIDFNIPFPPLLEPLRGVDIIIASNASRNPDIENNFALKGIHRYAERKNLKFPPIDFEKEEEDGDLLCNRPVSLFYDEEDPDCPIIIYLPLSANPDYKNGFDPQENARKGGYCGTFNFDINPDQFNELTGLTRYTATLAKEAILFAMEMKIKQRKIKS